MGFSKEWDEAYKKNQQLSVWPWSSLVSLSHRYGKLHEGMKVLELGCGAGANIPFFVSIGADYHAVEGSQTMVDKLNEQFKDQNVHVVQGDFTKDIPSVWGGWDIIVDRSSLTHNATADIKNAISIVERIIAEDGIYLGIDWFSTSYADFSQPDAQIIDDNTRVFNSGYFAGLGRVHFSDSKHIRELFSNFTLKYLAEHRNYVELPNKTLTASWNFVATKNS